MFDATCMVLVSLSGNLSLVMPGVLLVSYARTVVAATPKEMM